MSEEKQKLETIVEKSEFKGNPVLGIYEIDDKGEKRPYPFSFGKKKARDIVKHYEEIKAFAEEGK